MKTQNAKLKIFSFIFLFIISAILIEMNILNYSNKKQIYKASKIMVDQIENILSANDLSEREILTELKDEYIKKAITVAYIFHEDNSIINNIAEQKRIAEMMGIDEICLFDSTGYLYGGTQPDYYGLSFDSGEQISFFKPMLSDKNLTLCQNITPNTHSAKNMMYAMTWDVTKTYLVQVGIEPVRLLNALKNNRVHEVVNQMPVYKGMSIYVADRKTGKILGTTNENYLNESLLESDLVNSKDDLQSSKLKSIHLNGFRHYCLYRTHSNYIIAVLHSTEANLESFIISITIEIIWLLLSGSIIAYTLLKLSNANREIKKQISILKSISDIYYSMHLINLSNYKIEKLESNTLMDDVVKHGHNASDMLKTIVGTTIEDDYIEPALKFTDLDTLKERLNNKNFITMDAIDKNVGWLRISFITVTKDHNNQVSKVILATQIIDEEKKREEELSDKAHKDELTGLYNRRAYEDDLLIYPDVPPEKDFTYAAIDINGLKTTNDELGHAAGDELIKGAADCLKETLGNYGKVYRTGGDEFVSMFFADEEHLRAVLSDLDKATADWKGEYSTSLTMSVGYVTKREFTKETVLEMSKVADKRMYQAKKDFYSKKGIDRRGQAAAHTALCNLYAKILKINLTDDSYTIVNMDTAEQTSEKGFSHKISQWLRNFGETGQVHNEDLEEYYKKTDIAYLKDYFKQDKTSISIFYRRKFNDIYKDVVMEMIPANDYTPENQSLFLYVKSIDK